jgi:hypothetical protein
MKDYTVLIGGLEHTLTLSEADAKRYGVWVEAKSEHKAVKPANKAAAPRNKS